MTDCSFSSEDAFSFVIFSFEPLVIKLFFSLRTLLNLSGFIGDARHDGEWRFFVGESHFDGMRTKMQHHGSAAFVLDFIDELGFGL